MLVTILYECPECGGPLRLRHRRADGRPFIGCDRYPRCDWTSRYDAREQALAQTLESMRAELDQLRVKSSHALDGPVSLRDIRHLVSWGHPDKWPSGCVPAHELGKRLVALLTKARTA